MNLSLLLIANDSGILKLLIGGLFVVHTNIRGNTGGGLSLGRIFPIVTSTKHKLNTRRSTETKVVGLDYSIHSVF